MKSITQEKLLNIARTWHIKRGLNYRAFKCANCRRFLLRAWHYWLYIGGFKTPIHLCLGCNRNLNITYPVLNTCPVREPHKKHRNFSNGVNLKRIKFTFQKKIKNSLTGIVSGWNINQAPRYRKFSCDYCKRSIHKAYHIFTKINRKISEVHLCRHCWQGIGSAVEDSD